MLYKQTLFIVSGFFFCTLFPAADSASASDSLQRRFTLACKSDDDARAYDLIREGANPNTTGPNGLNAAHVAVMNNAKQTLRMLCKKTDVDTNACTKTNETPLSIAIRKHKDDACDLIEILLAGKANPNKPATSVLWTPLMLASRCDSTTIMRSLLSHNAAADVEVKGQTALSIAYRFLCADAADLLLSTTPAKPPLHPLYYVFGKNGNFSHDDTRDINPLLEVLKKHDIDLNAPIHLSEYTIPALYHVIVNPQTIHALKTFIAQGLRISDSAVLLLFEDCMTDQNTYSIEKLIACLRTAAPESDCIDKKNGIYKIDDLSLVLVALRNRRIDLAYELMRHYPHYCTTETDCLDADGMHPIHYIVKLDTQDESCRAQLIKSCLKAIRLLAPYVNVKSLNGNTPLMHAVNPEYAALLIALGADMSPRNADGSSVIKQHIILPNLKMVKFLLAQNPYYHTAAGRASLKKFAEEISSSYKEKLENIIAGPENPEIAVHFHTLIQNIPKLIEIINMLTVPTAGKTDEEIDTIVQEMTRKKIAWANTISAQFVKLNERSLAQRETHPRALIRARLPLPPSTSTDTNAQGSQTAASSSQDI